MAKLSAAEIYAHAIGAGFSADEAVTMTAIALAESGGETGSLNDRNEYSVGLWQINLDAHRDKFGTWDLTDPAQNAKAAFIVSGGGDNISPWTVTHRSRGARYQQFQDDALTAARENGHDGLAGNFTGSAGYGTATGAGSDGGGAAPVEPAAVPSMPPASGETDTPLERFLKLAVAQAGDPYDSDHREPDANNPNPDTLDCSELVQWAAHQADVEVVDGSWLQYFQLQEQGAEMSIDEAMDTPGALLFSFDPPPTRGGGRPGNKAHVAISLGDGRTIEAMGSKYGIKVAEANRDRWTNAGMIPGFKDQAVDMDDVMTWVGRDDEFAQLLGAPLDASPAVGVPSATTVGQPIVSGSAADADSDGLTDAFEKARGWNPVSKDTDDDGLSDLYELLEVGSDPARADTDADGTIDSIELAVRRNPLLADTASQAAGPGDVDSDADGLSDARERAGGFDPLNIDSDNDGLTDRVEADMEDSWTPTALEDLNAAEPV